MAIALEIYEALRSVGVAPSAAIHGAPGTASPPGAEDSKAKSTAEKFDQAVENRLTRELQHLATREDLARLEVRIGQMATREDLANMRGDLIKWNVGTMIAVAGLTLAIVKLVG